MGYGDFKLLAALGTWLGWQTLPQLVLIACVLGLMFFVFTKKEVNQVFAFGSFMIMAVPIVLVQKIL